ncbi:U11/U12 small nuclear ribonucleoprotein 48 kDa protein-like [Centruroides vittatus]|uniref:U11/U12 small nuclear ribonucleoprotein 48 kDa protein-like n=1 Tax=Centruroides vittatus TaxID=120091 RepID=UPI00351072D3
MKQREESIKEISYFIDSIENRLQNFMKHVGWSRLGKEEMVTCPLNPNHYMPQSSLAKHVETCSWIADGYTKKEKEESLSSSHFFYKNSTSVVPVLIDEETQHKIICEVNGKNPLQDNSEPKKKVPRTMDRCMTELTQKERLAIYDYVVEYAKVTNKPVSIKLEDLQVNFAKSDKMDDKEPKSHLEVLAEERDYKRRRPSYRAKNVHITKKSYTEILKEVIQNQMEYLVECRVEEERNEEYKGCRSEDTRVKAHSRERKYRSSHHKSKHHIK